MNWKPSDQEQKIKNTSYVTIGEFQNPAVIILLLIPKTSQSTCAVPFEAIKQACMLSLDQ